MRYLSLIKYTFLIDPPPDRDRIEDRQYVQKKLEDHNQKSESDRHPLGERPFVSHIQILVNNKYIG